MYTSLRRPLILTMHANARFGCGGRSLSHPFSLSVVTIKCAAFLPSSTHLVYAVVMAAYTGRLHHTCVLQFTRCSEFVSTCGAELDGQSDWHGPGSDHALGGGGSTPSHAFAAPTPKAMAASPPQLPAALSAKVESAAVPSTASSSSWERPVHIGAQPKQPAALTVGAEVQ